MRDQKSEFWLFSPESHSSDFFSQNSHIYLKHEMNMNEHHFSRLSPPKLIYFPVWLVFQARWWLRRYDWSDHLSIKLFANGQFSLFFSELWVFSHNLEFSTRKKDRIVRLKSHNLCFSQWRKQASKAQVITTTVFTYEWSWRTRASKQWVIDKCVCYWAKKRVGGWWRVLAVWQKMLRKFTPLTWALGFSGKDKPTQ